jgi:hypothetical protein
MSAQSRGAAASYGDGLGDPQDEVLVHHDVGGVAALGDRAVAVEGRVRAHVALQAVLLLPRQAVHALPTGVDHATHTDPVIHGVLADLRADLDDLADDLVTDREGVGDLTPLAAHGVDVGVTDAGVADRYQDVRRTDVAALDGGRNERFGGGRAA